MSSYLSAVWQCRYFWMSLVRMDLRTRSSGSLLAQSAGRCAAVP